MNWRKTIILFLIMALVSGSMLVGVATEKKKVTLKATFAAPKARWDFMMSKVEKKYEAKHPNVDLEIDYEVLPYGQMHKKLGTMMAGRTPRDLVSMDCIWLGQYSDYLANITKDVKDWGRIDEYYDFARKGSQYKGKYKGIWSWTDARVIWYWKEMLKKAGVKPEKLKTWDGYIKAAKKLNSYWEPKGVKGALLIGDPWKSDWWYPYLWMQGGSIAKRAETPEHSGWYPAYYGPAGMSALRFIVDQVDAGIEPLTGHRWGERFADRKYATWLGGTWAVGKVPKKDWDKIGLIAGFPTPTEKADTSTMMGGWVLGVPKYAKDPKVATEVLFMLQDPEINSAFLSKFGYLPTQKTVMEQASYREKLKNYWGDWLSKFEKLLPHGHRRPNFAEYPKLANHINIAIEEAYFHKKTPQKALIDAAVKSCEVLGWPDKYRPKLK